MIQEDTVKLLRECNAGIKMGVSSLDEVLPKVQSASLRNSLEKCRQAHGKLGDETHALLARYGDAGKEPSPVAKGMSWMKTNVKLALEESDETVADLITEGCNMGVKSLSRYLNQYEAAEERPAGAGGAPAGPGLCAGGGTTAAPAKSSHPRGPRRSSTR